MRTESYTPFAAQDIPELRHTLVDYHRTITPSMWTYALSMGEGGMFWIPTEWAHLPYRQIATHLAEAEADRVQAAELYSISREATREAIEAGKLLPRFSLHPAHLPSEHGFVVWDEPVDTAYGVSEPIVAASWGPHGDGVWVSFYVDGRRVVDLLSGRERAEAERMLHPLGFEREIPLRFGQHHWFSEQPGLERVAADYERPVRTLLATWLHMRQQRLTQVQEQQPDRKSRVARTLAKRGRPLPPVRVVSLRPGESAGEGSPGSGRRLAVRVDVAAYWRRRPHTSGQGPEDMVWVRGHERGPEGAPPVEGSVVKRVR